MNLKSFAERNQIWPRLRRAMLVFWLPLVLLAVIPVVEVLGILWIIMIGFLAGVIARLLVPEPDDLKSFVLTTLLGIAGASLATVIGESIGWFRGDNLVNAMIFAAIAVLILNLWVALLPTPRHRDW